MSIEGEAIPKAPPESDTERTQELPRLNAGGLIGVLRVAGAMHSQDAQLPPALAEHTEYVDERSWLRRNAGGLAAAGFLATAIAGAYFYGHHAVNVADRPLGPKYTYTPSAPYTPLPESASPSVSVRAKALPSLSPSSVPTSAAPTHSRLVFASSKPKPTHSKATKPAAPAPSKTKTTAAAHCWTTSSTDPNVSDPLAECSPAVIPLERAGSGSPETSLTISATNTTIHIDKTNPVNNYYRVYLPSTNGGEQFSGWIPEADF